MSEENNNEIEFETVPSSADAVSANGLAPKNDLLVSAFEWVELFVFSFSIVLIIITLFFRHAPVDGGSMTHTLQDGDLLIVNELFYTPKQGDIVVVQAKGVGFDEPLVKRVIAVGGENVVVDIDFDTWTVFINGEPLDEDYVRYADIRGNDIDEEFAKTPGTVPMMQEGMQFPLEIPEGYIFVLGDNRNNSKDSRSPEVGLIDVRHVVGKVILRIFPFDKVTVF